MGQKGKLAGREQEAKQLRLRGKSDFEIACHFGVYPWAIKKLFERLDKQAARQAAEQGR